MNHEEPTDLEPVQLEIQVEESARLTKERSIEREREMTTQ